LRTVSQAVLLVGMIALAGWTLGEIYAGPLLFELVAGAGLASVTLAVVARGLPSWCAAPVSVAGLVGYLAFAVHLSAQRADVPGGLLDVATDALANGVPRLLTALVPIEPQPDSVSIPIVAAWLAGLTASELSVRGRALLALAPPTILYAAALVLVGPHRAGVWAAVGYAGLAVATLATAPRPQASTASVHGSVPPSDNALGVDAATRRALQVRAAVAALVGVAAIVAAAAVAGPGLSAAVTRNPVDPRAYVSPPRLDALDQNPLIRLSGWAVNPTEHLLDATLSADQPLRLAVLTAYDGITWHVDGDYRPAARTLPSPAVAAAGASVTVTQQITVVGLTGKLLPAVASPRRVDGVRVSLEPASGTLLLPDGLRAGLTYDVTSRTAVPDDNILPMADVPTGPAVSELLSLGGSQPPERMQQLARRLADDNSAAYDRALAIEQFLSTHYRLDASAPSGHALPNLDFFLFGAANGAGGGKGTAEQFAASFAVLARMTGLPSRVVVGFHGKRGQQQILAKDASAWPEVLFDGVGWVAFDPLPHKDQSPEPLESQFRPQPPPSSEPPVQDILPTESVSAAAAASSGGAVVAQDRTVAIRAVGIGTGGLFIVVLTGLVLAVLLARQGLRRRRLDTGEPAHRVAGAWLEVTDALRLAGRRSPDHLAASEVATHAASATLGARHVRQSAPSLDDLAALVNAAEFGGTPITEHDAARAKADAVAYAAQLRARRSWWRRLIWSLHPGPLRWHR
jgi:transglutaminase-like putative cysteine protease